MTVPTPPSAQVKRGIHVLAILVAGRPTQYVALGSPESIKIRNPESGEDTEIVLMIDEGQFALAYKDKT